MQRVSSWAHLSNETPSEGLWKILETVEEWVFIGNEGIPPDQEARLRQPRNCQGRQSSCCFRWNSPEKLLEAWKNRKHYLWLWWWHLRCPSMSKDQVRKFYHFETTYSTLISLGCSLRSKSGSNRRTRQVIVTFTDFARVAWILWSSKLMESSYTYSLSSSCSSKR